MWLIILGYFLVGVAAVLLCLHFWGKLLEVVRNLFDGSS